MVRPSYTKAAGGLRLRLAALAGAAALAGLQSPTLAQEFSPPVENVEWTWADKPAQLAPDLPNVLLVGDSISRAYATPLRCLLRERANVFLFATSASVGDDRLADQLFEAGALWRARFSVVHLNNGLHGAQISDARFASGYPDLIGSLRHLAPDAAIIIATSTPVRDAGGEGLSNARVIERNTAAVAVATLQGLPIDDQYALMTEHSDLHVDDIHYDAAGAALQALQAAQTIVAALPAERRETATKGSWPSCEAAPG